MKSRTLGQGLPGARIRRTVRRGWLNPLRASELRFRRLFETTQDGVLILDGTSHKILEANPFMIQLLGRSKQELLGKELFELGILTDGQAARQTFEKLENVGFVRFEHSSLQSNTGQVKELQFVCNVYEEDGKSLIQCNIRDITDRKENERQLRRALEQLAAAKSELETQVQAGTADLQERNAELEAFSYSLSHDLRAPIRAIVSFTEIALNEYGAKVGPPATELLQKVINAAQRLDRLIADVLSFSKTTRRQRIKSETVNVECLLLEILQERPEWMPPKAEISIEGPLLTVRGDQASLTQCLTNLLDNAVKFMRSGVMPRVRIYTEPIGASVRLCIEDNGVGIPLDAQARIFELFQRAHNGYEGHGIGLAIVRRAAERMGGSIGLSSEPGRGSKFWLELPGLQQHAEAGRVTA